jgi:hypothetical protein
MKKKRGPYSIPLAPVVLHRYDVHRLANIEGLTALEIEPGSVAANEIAALWYWVSTFVQTSTGAIVHRGAA